MNCLLPRAAGVRGALSGSGRCWVAAGSTFVGAAGMSGGGAGTDEAGPCTIVTVLVSGTGGNDAGGADGSSTFLGSTFGKSNWALGEVCSGTGAGGGRRISTAR